MYRQPGPRLPPSPARAELERVNVHVGLKTRTPGETLSGLWEAEWWNGPTRPVRTYPTEAALITDLRCVFGPPEGDPDDQASRVPDSAER
jgi:hypothetical protein